MTSWRLQRLIIEQTQRQVARDAQIALDRLRAIEQGRTAPTGEETERLLEVLQRPFARGGESKVRGGPRAAFDDAVEIETPGTNRPAWSNSDGYY